MKFDIYYETDAIILSCSGYKGHLMLNVVRPCNVCMQG